MQPVEFPQQTDILAKDQPQYTPLPVHIKFEQQRMSDGEAIDVPMEMTACFNLSPEEIAAINKTGALWYTQCVFGNPFQPVRLSVLNPFASEDKATVPTTEHESGLPSDLFHAIHEAIGAASMCWDNPEGAGTFKSSKASEIASNLCKQVAAVLSRK